MKTVTYKKWELVAENIADWLNNVESLYNMALELETQRQRNAFILALTDLDKDYKHLSDNEKALVQVAIDNEIEIIHEENL